LIEIDDNLAAIFGQPGHLNFPGDDQVKVVRRLILIVNDLSFFEGQDCRAG